MGLGAYTMDSHNCQRVVVHGSVRNEGDVQVGGFPSVPDFLSFDLFRKKARWRIFSCPFAWRRRTSPMVPHAWSRFS